MKRCKTCRKATVSTTIALERGPRWRQTVVRERCRSCGAEQPGTARAYHGPHSAYDALTAEMPHLHEDGKYRKEEP